MKEDGRPFGQPAGTLRAEPVPVPGEAAHQALGCDDDGSCENDEHCCCCSPGERCCDCGHIMSDPPEVDALRRALRDLREACLRADALGELHDEIDGELLDAAGAALDLQYPIIWTPEQVQTLNERQQGRGHPYTCGGDRGSPAHLAYAEENCEDAGQLIATVRGWICPVCDYRQFWAHGIASVDGTPRRPEGAEVRRTASAGPAQQGDVQ